MSEVMTRSDLYGDKTMELAWIEACDLPEAVERWRKAICLWVALGNGWSDVLSQYTDYLVKGVRGFEDCGFEMGVTGAGEVYQVLHKFGIDPESPDFDEGFDSALPPEERDELRECIDEIDSRTMSAMWASRHDIESRLLARARALGQLC